MASKLATSSSSSAAVGERAARTTVEPTCSHRRHERRERGDQRHSRGQHGGNCLLSYRNYALLNGAGEREVKKLNLLTLPVFWCLGDGPTMHEEGALPGTPGRRVRALPMTDPLVTRPRADAQPQRPRPQVLVLACRRVCWALPGRHRAGGRTRRCVLKMTRWELTTWVVFVAVSAVWRLEARGVAVWPQLHVSGCGLPLVGW
mmetsp:Transcript_35470/g.83692  ORF Transcript_35470/g.83692 Transcript_35470/m.83692 type:complete len:203 (+) Transcript_35470:604-1212(+)